MDQLYFQLVQITFCKSSACAQSVYIHRLDHNRFTAPLLKNKKPITEPKTATVLSRLYSSFKLLQVITKTYLKHMHFYDTNSGFTECRTMCLNLHYSCILRHILQSLADKFSASPSKIMRGLQLLTKERYYTQLREAAKSISNYAMDDLGQLILQSLFISPNKSKNSFHSQCS